MSTFCGGDGTSIPSIPPEQWNDTYTGKGVVPTTLPDLSTGLVSDDWIKTYIGQLETNNTIPRSTSTLNNLQSNMHGPPQEVDPLATFVTDDNVFQNTVREEYCFYEKRYLAALDGFLQSIGDASMNGGNVNSVQTRLDTVIKLNQKLTLITQIVNGIAKNRYTTTQKYQQDINSLNDELKGKQAKLDAQRAIITKETAMLDVNRRMVEYTEEKNRANNNLLAIYSVLNVVAIALIFYIART